MSNASEKIGFIGLGELGLPIATNLLEAGYDLAVYNRTSSKAAPLAARGADQVYRPADTVTTGGIVVTLVWDDTALQSVVSGDGFLEKLGPNGIHLSMSKVLPQTSKRLAALHSQYGSSYVDASILGRPQAAVARQLLILFSGEKAAKARVRPLLQAMGAKNIFDFGEEVGSGNMVKLICNFLIASAGYSMNEALRVAHANRVDPIAVVEMLTNTLFAAPIYQNFGKLMAGATGVERFRGGKILLKDVGSFQQTAQAQPTPVARLLSDLLSQP